LILRSSDFYRETELRIVVDLVRTRLAKAVRSTMGDSSVTVGVDVWKSEESRDSFVTTTLHGVRRDFTGLFSCVVGALPIDEAHTGDNICQVAEDGALLVSAICVGNMFIRPSL
jgi:hypothetical protein